MIKSPSNIKTKIKSPNLVKVIKTHKNNSSSWWSNDPNTDLYYSSLLNDKHYIYSFLNEESAQNCIRFLNKYKQINNNYPNISMKDKLIKNRTDDFEIYIQDESFYSIKYNCMVNSANLAGILYFDYTFVDSFLGKKNVFNLSVSSVDLLENEEYNQHRQITHFNYLLGSN